MFYITQRSNKDSDDPRALVEPFFKQFDKEGKRYMEGCTLFISDMMAFMAKEAERAEYTKEQARLIKKASLIIGDEVEVFIDEKTEEYANRNLSILSPTLDPVQQIARGYQQSLARYTLKTNWLTETDVIARVLGEDSVSFVKSLYIATGIHLGGRLTALMNIDAKANFSFKSDPIQEIIKSRL